MRKSKNRNSGFLTWGGRVPKGPSHHIAAGEMKVVKVLPDEGRREFQRYFQQYLRERYPAKHKAFRQRVTYRHWTPGAQRRQPIGHSGQEKSEAREYAHRVMNEG